MGSYITGFVVAMGLVFGLYATHETTTGNSLFRQDKLNSLSAAELLVLAQDFSSRDQVEAILQLGNRPGELGETIPVLAQLATARYPMVKNAADASLEEIGAEGAEHLRDLVELNTTGGFRMACSAMRAIGPGSHIYIDEIKLLLEDDNPLLRKCGLYALQGIGENGKAAMDQIIVCVLDKDLNNQCSACRILEKFGPDAIDAEEALLTLQEKGGPSTRGWAAVCLGAIGPTSSDVDIAETLATQLNPRPDGRPVSPVEAQRVLTGLAYLGPEATKVVGSVREKMNDQNKFVAGHAAYALWRITDSADESLRTLRELLTDPNYVADGLYLIGRMGPDGIGLVDEVARSLRSPDASTRELAVVAIGKMGPAAKAYESSVNERMVDTSPLVRMASRRALRNLNEDPGKFASRVSNKGTPVNR